MEEEANLLYVYTWIYMSWIDNNLSWNPDDFDNIDYINVPPNSIWVPDLSIYNKMDLDLYSKSNPAVVRYNGRIYTVVMTDFTAYCSMDLTYWPNDEHTCAATIGSKLYPSTHIDFEFHSNTTVDTRTYLPNRQWNLKRVTATREEIEEDEPLQNRTNNVPVLKYEFKVQRYPSFIISTVFVPVLLLSSMVLLPLLIPFSSERCYNTLVLSAIGHVSYLQYLGSILQYNTNKSILIVSYVRDSLTMAIFALFTSVLIDRMTTTTEVPLWLFNLQKTWQSTPYSRMFLSGKSDSPKRGEEGGSMNGTDATSTSNNWSFWMPVVQRSIFLIYFIIYCTMFATFL